MGITCAICVYTDTSVLGGCFDEEFAAESTALVQMARSRRLVIVLSDVVLEELARAPVMVQQMVTDMPPYCVERVHRSAESRALQRAYIRDGVLGTKQRNDASHVALATVAGVDVIVSWNFKHIVHWDKIRMFNAVNLNRGYPPVDIRSPKEVV